MARKAKIDLRAIGAAVDAQRKGPTPGIEDISAYLARQVADPSHREVIGPLLAGSGVNDVRINLLCLALTALFRKELGTVLREHLLEPIGASASWSWHGYSNSYLKLEADTLAVVSGGAHWGGGIWMSARDLSLLGQLYLQEGRWGDRQVLAEAWVTSSFEPCAVNPDYGLLWWLNNAGRVFPSAPLTGRCARGNGGKHLLWVDPARALVVASHWGNDVGELLQALSAAIPAEHA